MTALSDEDFARLADPYRPDLLAFCYRMLGSLHDAEDEVQETMLRAWRSYRDFEGRASLRTWLYRIATNACLRALERRGRRPLPSGLGAPATDPQAPLTCAEVPWLQPFPDALLDPATQVAARAGIRLALVAALQYLPPRQRAVLILRDVLGWRAAEVADLLGATTAGVNSALQRARAQLQRAMPVEEHLAEPADPGRRALLDRYAAAFAEADIAALMELLTEDAVVEMPPHLEWFAGRDAVCGFLAPRAFTRPGVLVMVPTAANGQPAVAAYRRTGPGAPLAHSIQVLTTSPAGITRITAFREPSLFAAFGQPPALEPAPL